MLLTDLFLCTSQQLNSPSAGWAEGHTELAVPHSQGIARNLSFQVKKSYHRKTYEHHLIVNNLYFLLGRKNS